MRERVSKERYRQGRGQSNQEFARERVSEGKR